MYLKYRLKYLLYPTVGHFKSSSYGLIDRTNGFLSYILFIDDMAVSLKAVLSLPNMELGLNKRILSRI